jgi:hypothetical protein
MTWLNWVRIAGWSQEVVMVLCLGRSVPITKVILKFRPQLVLVNKGRLRSFVEIRINCWAHGGHHAFLNSFCRWLNVALNSCPRVLIDYGFWIVLSLSLARVKHDIWLTVYHVCKVNCVMNLMLGLDSLSESKVVVPLLQSVKIYIFVVLYKTVFSHLSCSRLPQGGF